MRAIKIVMAALLLLLVSSSLIASSAFAEWYVSGTKLAAGSKVPLTTVGIVEGTPTFSIPSLKIKIICNSTAMSSEAAEIVGPSSLKAKSLAFEGCETAEPKTGCELEGQPARISTFPLQGAETKGAKEPEDTLTVEPQTKKTFASIRIKEGSTCALGEGEQPINGSVMFNLPTGQDEMAEQYAEDTGSKSNSLTVGGAPLYLEHGSVGFGFRLNGQPAGVGARAALRFPILTTTPETIEFGKVKIHESRTANVRFENDAGVGDETPKLPAALLGIVRVYPQWLTISKDECKGEILKADDLNSCTIQIKYEPESSGLDLGELAIPGYARVPLSGTEE